MRKIIKKYGGCAVIVFSKEDLRCYGLAIDKVVDFYVTDVMDEASPSEKPKPKSEKGNKKAGDTPNDKAQ